MFMTRFTRAVACVLLAGTGLASAATTPIFRFESDEFWLNLHHFLYVLGRAESKTRDASRAAVADAPADSERGLQALTAQERMVWTESITAYAKGLSQKDAVFDDPLSETTHTLALAHDSASLPPSAIDSSTRAILEAAAPIYRKAWWPKHQAQNRDLQVALEELLKLDGAGVLKFITRAYEMPWPASGYPVHLSAYSNWAGAYSTSGNLLVVASNPGAANQGLYGLEIVFHEGMHQWDDGMLALLRAQAGTAAADRLPRGLSHALIFYTAGEAVRSVVPEHVPYADKFGVWARGMMPLQAALVEAWKPYLEGHGTRDQALKALVQLVLSR